VMMYEVIRLENETRVEIDTLLRSEAISVGAPSDAKVTFTATTDMQLAMGKVISIDNSKAVLVDTVWGGSRQVVACVPVGTISLGEMVWATEHLSLDGNMEILASKRKSSFGDINFINLSWQDSKVRIDVLTGETRS